MMKVDFISGEIILTKAMAKRAENPHSQEYRDLVKVVKDLPDFKVCIRCSSKRYAV